MASRSLLFAFVALVLSVMAVSTVAEKPISHNAMVRRHAAVMSARPARRSIPVAQGQRFQQKRQTPEQLAQAAALKQWDDDFHAKNAEWQQAAMDALKQGQTPPTFDEYWNGKSSGSSTASSSSSTPSSSSSAASSDASSTSGSDTSSNAPATKQAATSQNSSSQSSSSNASSDNSGSDSSDSDQCEQDDSSDSSSTSTSTPAAAPQTNQQVATGSDKSSSGTSSSSAPAASSSSSSSSGSGSGSLTPGSTGQGTYFAPGLGACGWYNSGSDHIVAISHSLFDSFGTGNPNNNPACGHKIKATYQGKSTTVTVVDRCEGCAWGDLDFTETAFQDLAALSIGRLDGVTWEWVGSAP